MRENQELTFENKKDLFLNPNIPYIDDLSDNNSAIKNNDIRKDNMFHSTSKSKSDSDSSLIINNSETNKGNSKTPILNDSKEGFLPNSAITDSLNNKEECKSLELRKQLRTQHVNKHQSEELKNYNDELTSSSLSLVRNKSEHNLKESKDTKSNNGTEIVKEKSYNSKNFFTENFDDQEIEDAINKIKNNPDFENDESPGKNYHNDVEYNLFENNQQNIEFSKEEESISFDEDSKKIVIMKPLINIIEGPSNDPKDDVDDDSSVSDNLDLTKTVNLKKEGIFKINNNSKEESNQRKETKSNNIFESKDNTAENESKNDTDSMKHSKSFEELKEKSTLKTNNNSIKLKDTRQKIDDDDDEDCIITGSQIIESFQTKQSEGDINKNKPDSMASYFKYSKLVKDDNLTGDIKIVIDGILQGLISELDQQLFPQRPLFLLTADLREISLEQATNLLNDLTPEKERIIVEKIIEKQKESKRHRSKNKKHHEGKLVLYEKKGIRTDLVAIENYIEGLYTYIEKTKKKEFIKECFTSIKKDPFEMLNQLQNSDIGCYEHFEFDYNFYAVLQVDAYLEMENYRKIQEIEEEKAIKSGELVPKETKGKSRPFRKRFEFDETGLTEEQINEK